MKSHLFCLGFSSIASANIAFQWVQPRCDLGLGNWTGCLLGQTCNINGTCVNNSLTKRDYSLDGRCGPRNGGLLCDPDSSVYAGTCCSQHGWCGQSTDHCGSGCTSNCSVSVIPTKTTGAIGEPALGQDLSATAAGSPASGGTTHDGTCGSHHGNTICGDWYKGSCCSMYGFCGNTTAHCGDGCQSGPCANGSQPSAPASSPAPMATHPGTFAIIGQSGVPAMHAALMENGRIIFLDKVENYTQLHLDNGQLAYSAEFDPSNPSNPALPLGYETNAFCSAGSFLADGRLLNIGGNAPLSWMDPTVGDGFTGLRYLQRSATDNHSTGQSWAEPGNKLNTARWYASAQTMANGSIFVASGSLNGLDPAVAANNNPTYEILNSQGVSNGYSVQMDILVRNQPYYMYPFMHLLRDGSLFVAVAKSAELFNITAQSTSRLFPDLQGLYRTYPNTGGSVLLPLTSQNDWSADIVICGGGAYQAPDSPSDASCGRISPLAANAVWEIESLPVGRVMVEGTLLPDGKVLWMNGCNSGAQGFEMGQSPTLEALIYDPTQPAGSRFSVGASSTIPRLYHSVALLALDGTVIVAGSNPVEQPVLRPQYQNPYVTEFRVERYTPPYLSDGNADRRPFNISVSKTELVSNGSAFTVSYSAPTSGNEVSVVLYHGGFVTHSLHMGHRMAILDTQGFTTGTTSQSLQVNMPPNGNIAPPGPYVLFVLQDGVPGYGQFVRVV